MSVLTFSDEESSCLLLATEELIYSIYEPLPQVLLDNICTWKFFLYLKEFNYLRADYLATLRDCSQADLDWAA